MTSPNKSENLLLVVIRHQLEPETVVLPPPAIGRHAPWPIAAQYQRAPAGFGPADEHVTFQLCGDDALLEVELGERVEFGAGGRDLAVIGGDQQPHPALSQLVDVGQPQQRVSRKPVETVGNDDLAGFDRGNQLAPDRTLTESGGAGEA